MLRLIGDFVDLLPREARNAVVRLEILLCFCCKGVNPQGPFSEGVKVYIYKELYIYIYTYIRKESLVYDGR